MRESFRLESLNILFKRHQIVIDVLCHPFQPIIDGWRRHRPLRVMIIT